MAPTPKQKYVKKYTKTLIAFSLVALFGLSLTLGLKYYGKTAGASNLGIVGVIGYTSDVPTGSYQSISWNSVSLATFLTGSYTCPAGYSSTVSNNSSFTGGPVYDSSDKTWSLSTKTVKSTDSTPEFYHGVFTPGLINNTVHNVGSFSYTVQTDPANPNMLQATGNYWDDSVTTKTAYTSPSFTEALGSMAEWNAAPIVSGPKTAAAHDICAKNSTTTGGTGNTGGTN